jgi:hypothetical protein
MKTGIWLSVIFILTLSAVDIFAADYYVLSGATDAGA